MTINLVKNGIFPIIYNKDGELINEDLDTGFQISGTVQGEGKLTGTPCLFVRTSGCNIRCVWLNENGGSPCDTAYSSHHPESNKMEIQDIVDTLKHNLGTNIKHLVISGGEPFQQTKQLRELVTEIKKQLPFIHITIETNATIFDEEAAKLVDLISMSPKLSNSDPTEDKFTGKEMENFTYNTNWERKHKDLRRNIDVIQKFINTALNNNNDFQLKFVISNEIDLDEVRQFEKELYNIKSSDILLMPEGYFAEDIIKKSIWITNKCVENGYGFTTRLHTLLFGAKRGV